MHTIKFKTYAFLVFATFFSSFVENIFAQKNNSTKLIPIETLFSKPEKSSVKISPNGKMISYLAQHNKTQSIWVKTVGKNDDQPVTDQTTSDIKNYFWHYNNNHVLYIRNENSNGSCNLYMSDIYTKQEINLTPSEHFIVNSILSYKQETPNEIVITTKKPDAQFIDCDAYKIDTKTGEIVLLGANDGNIINWFLDTSDNIRAIKKLNGDGLYELFLKNNPDTDFQSVGLLEREDSPVGFSQNGSIFYSIDSRNSDTKKLVTIDPISGKTKIIFEDTNYDVDSAIFNPNSDKLEATVVFKYRKTWIFFDEQFENDMQQISTLDYGDISLCSRSSDDTKWIIGFIKDNGPTSFWMFDRKTKEGKFIFFENDSLSQYEFARVEPIQLSARDGLSLEGYITYPKNTDRKNLPFVLLVHGGPWGRNTWRFDPEVQWLANHGCAVLQINFRGSTGYGKSFLHAGDKQWGKKMQNDLLDAVDWAIKNKIADPEKVCIYGFSYGGYTAIMGAALTPEKFCCAVDICGPKNLPDKVHEFVTRFCHVKQINYDRVGNPETEIELLKSASPVTYGEKINTPLFMVSGAHDFRVKKKDTEKIVFALEKNNVPYKNLFFEDEGHWITKKSNKLHLYSSLEKFLAKYLTQT